MIKIDPKHSASYHGLGLICDKKNEYQEAIEYFNEAIKLEEGNSVYWHNRGCCYRNMGKYVRYIYMIKLD